MTNETQRLSWLQWVAPIISAVAVIVTGWFAYNQTRHDKLTDLEIEVLRQQKVWQANVDNENAAKINGALWTLLAELDVLRVYIIQPHPPHDPKLLSATFEVRAAGVSPIKETIKNVPMSEVPQFAALLAEKEYVYIPDVDTDTRIGDKSKAIFTTNGTHTIAITKLVDARGSWSGNLVVDAGKDYHGDLQQFGNEYLKTARFVQFLLPNYGGER